jgi:exopolyphosphatase / guanosine-5'-triphosphate,3'-diphosphate pyrophosphatase
VTSGSAADVQSTAGAAIVPRWEWRTFGGDLASADSRVAGLSPDRVQESDEIYLLSRVSDASVKFRDEVMDVKRLEEVSDDGLEQWRPVMKASFPLSQSDIAAVLEALGVGAPQLERESYTLDQLLDEVVGPADDLREVAVHKRRVHYLVDGCMAEFSEIRTDDGERRTIAVESEDPALVSATVRELGLAARRNVNVPRGLKALGGFGARRFAVLDVGTNSVKFHVGERLADGSWRTVVDRAAVTRLGEGLDDSGELGEAAMSRTLEAIAGMAEEARAEGAEEIAAVGTAGMRIASNSAAFVDAVEKRSGVHIDVIPGEEEARLAYLAATAALGVGDSSLVVFDTGGGSSQFTFGHGTHVDERFSVNVGAVRFTERFGLDGVVPQDRVEAALAAIAADFERLDGRAEPETIVGIGGAVTNLAAVKHRLAEYDADVVQGTVLDRAEVDREIELFRTRTADERREIVGLQPARAEVILAGACVVRTVLDKLGRDSLVVSDRGLRHGLLAQRFGGDD